MNTIRAKQTASITELKKNPYKLIKYAKSDPVAILKNNIPIAYLIQAKTFEKIVALLDQQ